MSKVRIARIKWNSAANDREFALDLLPELDGGLKYGCRQEVAGPGRDSG